MCRVIAVFFIVAQLLYMIKAVSAECINEPCLEITTKPTVLCCAGEKKTNVYTAIYCEGTNVEPMDLEWYSPDGILIQKRFSENDRVYVERRNKRGSNKFLEVLIFRSLQMKDNGKWTCKDKNLKLSDSFDVSVGVKATVDSSEETKVVQKNANVEMSCTVEGIPTPRVNWVRHMEDRNVFIENGYNPRFEISHNNDEHFLLIKNVDYTDSGKYSCRATQTELSHFARKDFTLKVQSGSEGEAGEIKVF